MLVPGIDAFAAGAQVVLEAVLQSPHFLYRTELTTGQGRVRLGDYEIAAKLSYALAGTMPDDDLFDAAAKGGLRNHDQISAQAERLLGKAGEPGVTFHEEFLNLRGLVGEIDKDAAKFPEFKPAWRDSIARESALFLGEIFNSGKGLTELLTAPFTFVDANVAPLYGVKAPAGADFARVDLDPKQRAGLLTQTAFLARSGTTESDPILRGAFLNHTLLCLDLEPPPGVTEMVPDPPASARTNRERVTAVTSATQCAACHAAFINPAGFAFENYDALGQLPDHRGRAAGQRGGHLQLCRRAEELQGRRRVQPIAGRESRGPRLLRPQLVHVPAGPSHAARGRAFHQVDVPALAGGAHVLAVARPDGGDRRQLSHPASLR